MGRPSTTIVVPFAGTDRELLSLYEQLRPIRRLDGDDLVVVDNSQETASVPAPEGIRLARAGFEGSSYHARNVGAETSQSEWILFMDADCVPSPNILDAYFEEPIPTGIGALSGGVQPLSLEGLVEKFASSRQHLDASVHLNDGAFAVTANLLVRRRAFDSVGGFCEGIRSGGDVDFTWRLQAAGWDIGLRAKAAVRHKHRESIGGLFRQFRRYGGAHAWLGRRYPERVATRFFLLRTTAGTFRRVFRAGANAIQNAAKGQWQASAFEVLDIVVAVAGLVGTFDHNRPRWSHRPNGTRQLGSVYVTPHFPMGQSLPEGTVVEAEHRAKKPKAWAVRDVTVHYWEDDSFPERLWATLRLGVTSFRAATDPHLRRKAPALVRAATLAEILGRPDSDATLADAAACTKSAYMRDNGHGAPAQPASAPPDLHGG